MKTFEEIVHYRRSVRHYQNVEIDAEKVRHCIELATLSPNSSNMQLWEFYHITEPEILKKLAVACLSQEAATTAKQMVIFVTRQDLHRKRAKKNGRTGNAKRLEKYTFRKTRKTNQALANVLRKSNAVFVF